jgi:hypothetical protein
MHTPYQKNEAKWLGWYALNVGPQYDKYVTKTARKLFIFVILSP